MKHYGAGSSFTVDITKYAKPGETVNLVLRVNDDLRSGMVSNAPYIKKGMLIDLFDPELPILQEKTINPGEQAFLFDISQIKNRHQPQVLASASRIYEQQSTKNSFVFVAKSPINTTNVMRILLPARPTKIIITNSKGAAIDSNASWSQESKTEFLKFENNPEGIHVSINW